MAAARGIKIDDSPPKSHYKSRVRKGHAARRVKCVYEYVYGPLKSRRLMYVYIHIYSLFISRNRRKIIHARVDRRESNNYTRIVSPVEICGGTFPRVRFRKARRKRRKSSSSRNAGRHTPRKKTSVRIPPDRKERERKKEGRGVGVRWISAAKVCRVCGYNAREFRRRKVSVY